MQPFNNQIPPQSFQYATTNPTSPVQAAVNNTNNSGAPLSLPAIGTFQSQPPNNTQYAPTMTQQTRATTTNSQVYYQQNNNPHNNSYPHNNNNNNPQQNNYQFQQYQQNNNNNYQHIPPQQQQQVHNNNNNVNNNTPNNNGSGGNGAVPYTISAIGNGGMGNNNNMTNMNPINNVNNPQLNRKRTRGGFDVKLLFAVHKTKSKYLYLQFYFKLFI